MEEEIALEGDKFALGDAEFEQGTEAFFAHPDALRYGGRRGWLASGFEEFPEDAATEAEVGGGEPGFEVGVGDCLVIACKQPTGDHVINQQRYSGWVDGLAAGEPVVELIAGDGGAEGAIIVQAEGGDEYGLLEKFLGIPVKRK